MPKTPLKPICAVEYHDNVQTWRGSNSGEPRSMPPEIWFRITVKTDDLKKVLRRRKYEAYGELHLYQIPATETARIEAEIAFLRPLTRMRFRTGAGLRFGNENERAKAAIEQADLDERWAQWEIRQQRERVLRAAHYEAVQIAQALFESYLSPDHHDEHRKWEERYHRLNKTLGDSTAPFLRRVLRTATGQGGWSGMRSNDLMEIADTIVTGPDTPTKRQLFAACGKDS